MILGTEREFRFFGYEVKSITKAENMEKEKLKHFRKGLKDSQSVMSIAVKRLNDGRYKSAEELMRGEAASLFKLADELSDVTEQQS